MPRQPKSIEAHRKTGTRSVAGQTVRGKRTAAAATPLVLGGRDIDRAKVTAHLDAEVKLIFEEILELGSAVLAGADVPMVEAAATMIARARMAARSIAQHGVIIETEFGPRPNPAIRIERDAWAQFRLLAEQIGIGPSARARLAVFGVKGDPAEKMVAGLAEVRSLTQARKAKTA